MDMEIYQQEQYYSCGALFIKEIRLLPSFYYHLYFEEALDRMVDEVLQELEKRIQEQ